MESITTGIVSIVVALIGFFGIFVKIRADNKTRKTTAEKFNEDLLNKIGKTDTLQTEKINNIEKEISRNNNDFENFKNDVKKELNKINNKTSVLMGGVLSIQETTKHSDYINKIKLRTIAVANDLLNKILIEDEEINIFAKMTVTRISEIFEYILVHKFVMNDAELFSLFKTKARENKTALNCKKLRVKEEIYEAMKNDVVYPSINIFIKKFNEIKNKQNGERRRRFYDICKQYTEQLILNSVEKIKEYRIK